MAGSGYKKFNAFDVLTAAEVQNYLMDQAVQVYSDSTARGSALGTAVSEGMVSFLKDTDSTEVYDGSSWVALGGGGIAEVAAGTALSGGGSSGTVTLDVNLESVATATPSATAVPSTSLRQITISTAIPSGGSDGDVWLVYTP